MSIPKSIQDYLRWFGTELGDRIVQMFPALYKPGDPVCPRMQTLLAETLSRAGSGGDVGGPALAGGTCGRRNRGMRNGKDFGGSRGNPLPF